jgi:hypothetical protein
LDLHEKEFEQIFPDIEVKAFFRNPVSIAEMTTRLNVLLDGDRDGESQTT